MKWILLAILSLMSVNLWASDGSSGCGPGWYVAKDNSILSSALRATTNGILVPTVTLGMTFGTSNCSKHSIVKNEQESLKFATENYFELASDSSKGAGDFLNAFTVTMGCKPEAQDLLGEQMQKNFKTLFPKKILNPENLLKETYILILKNQQLQKACFTA